MTEFEARLQECLAALHEGRWSIDDCLRRYPADAAALRPQLLTAQALSQAYAVAPREEFASVARERFLIATGQRLQEAMDLEPEPSFFAAARVRFLMAAQRAKLGERASQRQPRHVPLFGSPFRALAGGLASIAIFLSFSTYTVASASNSLPGDWQYGVKLQTERVRLALAFDDDSKRSIKLDIAEERVAEIEQLSKKGKIIGPGVLDRLVEQTQPLVNDARDGGWNSDDIERLSAVSAKEDSVLTQAVPQISIDAQSQLDQAKQVSRDARVAVAEVTLQQPDRQPAVVTASVPLATPTGIPVIIELPTSTATPGASATPDSAGTPTELAASPTVADASSGVTIGGTSVGSRNSIKLYPLSAGRIKANVPGPASGWFPIDDGQHGAHLIRLSNDVTTLGHDGSSLIVINTVNGDMYWYVNRGGHIDEVQMRITKDGGIFTADHVVLEAAYGDLANVPLYIMESIEVTPDVTPTPEASATPKATAAAASPTAAP